MNSFPEEEGVGGKGRLIRFSLLQVQSGVSGAPHPVRQKLPCWSKRADKEAHRGPWQFWTLYFLSSHERDWTGCLAFWKRNVILIYVNVCHEILYCVKRTCEISCCKRSEKLCVQLTRIRRGTVGRDACRACSLQMTSWAYVTGPVHVLL
jgi:hypothetical protein